MNTQTALATPKEPLYFVRHRDTHKGKGGRYTSTEALFRLVGWARREAIRCEFIKRRATQRLQRGDRFFDEDELREARNQLGCAQEGLKMFAFFESAFDFGAPLEEWEAHKGLLKSMLEQTDDKHFVGLSVEHLIGALSTDSNSTGLQAADEMAGHVRS